MSKRILVLGTNAGQADLIRYMKQTGWNVHACARTAGGVGDSIADEFHLTDVRDVDAVAELAAKIRADIVYSISSDLAMATVIKVSKRLNLPCFYDSQFYDLLTQKQRLRAFLNDRQISEVSFARADSVIGLEQWDTFPCIVKPSDSQGQRGVVRIDHPDQLKDAVETAIALSVDTNGAIIEAYLDGIEVSCNTLVRDGEIVFDVLSERLVHNGSNFGIPRGHLIPCVNLNEDQQAQALDLVHEIIEAFGRPDGCLYFQMIVTSEGPKVVEIAPRLDGCHMWRLIEAATGANYLAATMDTLLQRGAPRTRDPRVSPDEWYELMFQQAPVGMTFDEAEFPQPSGSLYFERRYSNGEKVRPINGRLENVGYYVRRALPGSHKHKQA